ncbi:hypothetical protein ACQEU5_14580 [Marinactinospora thermotolerans]|uniref:Uncharacterized protein n=1 Tax=Marinactinospora thermotolerans DSM 45154 TaxID=1122192 RepID=A0A1T4RRB4_9ACTN|nr:hypothetical protein [Marinactinospora thermotolerans]SKA18427.1 hypothetical protein SAMN02745673_02903 [Marinactinospora thermotolerans DSM 45154]
MDHRRPPAPSRGPLGVTVVAGAASGVVLALTPAVLLATLPASWSRAAPLLGVILLCAAITLVIVRPAPGVTAAGWGYIACFGVQLLFVIVAVTGAVLLGGSLLLWSGTG